MTSMALYARSDGLFEPRSTKALEFVKTNAPKLFIADIASNTRSQLQNRYLNGWVYTKQICNKLNDAGITIKGIPWTRDILHAVMQEKFLVKFEMEVEGIDVKVYYSTANMSPKRFGKYIDEEIKPYVLDAFEITIDDPRDGFYAELMREIKR